MEALYDDRKDGPYYYWRGFNWRAFAAYVLGIIPNFWGFLGDLGVSVTEATTHMEYFSCIIGMVVSFFFYWAFTHFFSPKNGIAFSLKEWKEPKDYIDPRDPFLVDGIPTDEESHSRAYLGVTYPELGMDTPEKI